MTRTNTSQFFLSFFYLLTGFIILDYGYLLLKPFFVSSFSEGNNLSSLVVTAENEIQMLNDNQYLMGKTVDSNERTYTLAHVNFKRLQEIEMQIQSIASVKSTQLTR